MIIKNIDYDPFAMTIFFVQPTFALSGIAIVMREGINSSMKVQAKLYIWGEILWDPAFDEITNEATQLMPRIIAGQM